MPKVLLPSNETGRILALHSYKILDTPNEPTFERLVQLAAQLAGCPIALISLVDENRQWLKAGYGLAISETPRDIAFSAHTILDPMSVLIVPDTSSDSRFSHNPLVTDAVGIRFYAGIPLVNQEGFALGSLCVIDYVPRQIDPVSVQRLLDLAQIVMSVIEMRKAAALSRGPEPQLKQQELERANADLRAFAYSAAHDLKAPLRAIAHLADWIHDDIKTLGNLHAISNLKLLQARAARLQRLLDDMLAYAVAGPANTAVEDVDIAELVDGIVTLLDLPAGFTVTCLEPRAVIRTHRTPIETILKNLISNAVQHHDRKSGQVTIAVQVLNGVAEFNISDDGPGIPKRFHDRIFLLFQTLKSREDTESTGIGLSLVKKHIEINGGHIEVESNPPTRGTTFMFTWNLGPVRPDQSAHSM